MPRKPAKGKAPSRRAWRQWVEPWYLGQHPSDEIKTVVEWEA